MFAQKDFEVKPIALVDVGVDGSLRSRVQSLLRLSASVLTQTFFLAGLEKLPPESPELEELESYFSVLPLSTRDIVFNLVNLTLNSKLEKNYSMVRRIQSSESSFSGWNLFNRHSSSLELSEIVAESGSRQIFKYIQESRNLFPQISKVSLGSSEISKEKLSFLYEVSDSTWKPELKIFLIKLENISHLILRYFCDDDTLSIVGRNCRKLEYLKIQIIPEHAEEQQITDDGFDELICAQERHSSLRELDIKDCFSESVTSKTLTSLYRIKTLTSLHLRSSHFSWIKLPLRLHSAIPQWFHPNTSLINMSINFFSNQTEHSNRFHGFFNGVPEVDFVTDVLNTVPILFSALKTVEFDGIHNDLLYLDGPDIPGPMYGLVTFLRIRKCSRILDLSELMPNLKELYINYVPLSKCKNPRFENLVKLRICRDNYRDRIDYQDLKDLLQACVQLRELHLDKISLFVRRDGIDDKITDSDILQLLHDHPHLTNLTKLNLDFSRASSLSEKSVFSLLENCPGLRRLENLITWNISRESLNPEYLLSRFRMGVVYGSRSHWSLHWKGEDGTFYDSAVPMDRF